MTEPQSADSNEPDVPAASAGQLEPPRTPRWVKITGVLIALFVLGFLARALFGDGSGGHGPGMHGGLGSLAPPPSSSAALARSQAPPGM